MNKFRILGVALVALFACGVVATTASAVEFLLALWLLNNAAVTTPVLVDGEGDVVLRETNGGGLGLTFEILCEGIGDGFVESESKGLITELLTLGGSAVSRTALVEPALSCVNITNCVEPLVWAENLPWETEVELMIDGTETFFIGLGLNGAFYVECMSLKISELCEAAESAVQLINEANGTVDALNTDAFQTLAGLKLGNCTLGGAESVELTGLGIILDTEGGSLSVSSE